MQAARAEDSKGLSAAIVHWITASEMGSTSPLDGKSRRNRGFHHNATGALLCPINLNWSHSECVIYYTLESALAHCGGRIRVKLRSGEMNCLEDQWPQFMYSKARAVLDPWDGFLRNSLVVSVKIPFVKRVHRSLLIA